ncbi:hypothetical protein RUM44_005521 [Polyplax serrata]|uniref:LEM domain-containing protein n=1 Tax=Polyplax serrata TaxID=468196 RepID=A0ABR1ADM7_POLSC
MIESMIVKKVLRAFDNKDVSTINSWAIQRKINPNALIPGRGVSLLHLIIGHQSENFGYKITKLFLRCGGDPNVQSADKVTPTHVAAGWGRNRILHLLLVNGGDPWMQDDEKRNAFNYAFEEQEWNTIEMLHHFQQMHAATPSKMGFGQAYVKRDLERVLFRRGEQMFSYAPVANVKKSITTQTQSFTSRSPSSPVQGKIKYFEGNQNVTYNMNSQKKSDVGNPGSCKEVYETSCEMYVDYNQKSTCNERTKQRETYISSIHIETSPDTSGSKGVQLETRSYQQIEGNKASKDVRGQLLVELREAVRRRSKMKISQTDSKTDIFAEHSDSVVILNSDANNSSGASENIEVYKSNLQGNEMLKNMSDFATQVMNEIEEEKKIDVSISSPDLANNYVSCDEDPNLLKLNGKNIQTIVIPQSNNQNSTFYLTPYNSGVSHELTNVEKSKEDLSNDSFASVSEEYRYTDAEEGVVLLEKKILVAPTISEVSQVIDVRDDENCECDDGSTVSSGISCNSDVLRCELMGLGYNPGPVTKTTKHLYLKKLWKIKRDAKTSVKPINENASKVYSVALKKTLYNNDNALEKVVNFRHLEEDMCRSFERWTTRKWREGNNKTSFNYLLLDPRVSLNLPKRAHEISRLDTWKCFLSSIFYIGKGKRSRPYAHLYKAVAFWQKKRADCSDDKIQRIVEIWKEGLGVVCLQVFQNIMPVEALTREAAMIDALGLSSLKNARLGEYYGIVSTWPLKEKRNLGIFLLHKALLIFLNEGERQIKPYDID